MIEISENDLPITVAQKLITATYEIPDDATFSKALNKACGGDGTRDAFEEDELKEIAEYLLIYCEKQNEREIKLNELKEQK